MSENPEEPGVPKQLTKLSVDFDRWYTDVIRLTEMADYSGVRGCMVIRPYGYAMWENIQRAFDDMIKETGHENAYFPLLIPYDYFSKEADHVEGFAPEVAWVQYAGPKPVLKPPSEWTDEDRRQEEAGWLATTPVAFPRIDWLGVFPSQQSLCAQTLILSIVIIAFFVNRRSAIPSS